MTSREVGARREQILSERRAVLPAAPLTEDVAAQAELYRLRRFAELRMSTPLSATPQSTTPLSAPLASTREPIGDSSRRTATFASEVATLSRKETGAASAEPHVHSARALEKQRARRKEQLRDLEMKIEEERAARRALKQQLDRVVVLSQKMVELESV